MMKSLFLSSGRRRTGVSWMNKMFFIFIISYLILYSGMHLYFYLGFRHIVPSGYPWIASGYPVFAAFMIAAPVLSRYFERTGLFYLQKIFAVTGYIWMGILFLLSKLRPGMMPFTVSGRSRFLISMVFALIISVYGYYEAGNITTGRIVFRSSLLPEDRDIFRIVQISDVHLGVMSGASRLARITRSIKTLSPDIIVSTGDLVDGQMGKINGVSELMKELEPDSGKYAVTGNHEFYTGIGHAVEFTERAGFTVIRNSFVEPCSFISIAGVDDPAGKMLKANGEAMVKETDILRSMPEETLRILLKHQPVIQDGSADLFELQLSGHIHGGQIFPFHLFTRLAYKIRPGLSRADRDSWIYVSRGTGTWGPPVRFLSAPEVTVIDIVRCSGDIKFEHLPRGRDMLDEKGR